MIPKDDEFCEIGSSWEENGTREYFDKKIEKSAVPRSPTIGSIATIWKGLSMLVYGEHFHRNSCVWARDGWNGWEGSAMKRQSKFLIGFWFLESCLSCPNLGDSGIVETRYPFSPLNFLIPGFVLRVAEGLLTMKVGQENEVMSHR